MAKKKQKRQRAKPSTTVYLDDEGNALELRDALTPGTIRHLEESGGPAAAKLEDLDQRRVEQLFERLVVSWQIAGLPLRGQRELLGRYRLADTEMRAWVRATLAEHVAKHVEGLDEP